MNIRQILLTKNIRSDGNIVIWKIYSNPLAPSICCDCLRRTVMILQRTQMKMKDITLLRKDKKICIK